MEISAFLWIDKLQGLLDENELTKKVADLEAGLEKRLQKGYSTACVPALHLIQVRWKEVHVRWSGAARYLFISDTI